MNARSRRRAVIGSLSVLVLLVPTDARAHSVSTFGWSDPPEYRSDIARWDFRSHHEILECFDTGDGEPCSQGIWFVVWSGIEVRVGDRWIDVIYNDRKWKKNRPRHWPEITKAAIAEKLYCHEQDDDDAYIMRTRGRQGIRHGGRMVFAPEFTHSEPAVVGCPDGSGDESNLTPEELAEKMAQPPVGVLVEVSIAADAAGPVGGPRDTAEEGAWTAEAEVCVQTCKP